MFTVRTIVADWSRRVREAGVDESDGGQWRRRLGYGAGEALGGVQWTSTEADRESAFVSHRLSLPPAPIIVPTTVVAAAVLDEIEDVVLSV